DAGTTVVIDGSGIIDNSGNSFLDSPIIALSSQDAGDPSELDFTNSATAGDLVITFDGPASIIRFQGNSNAADSSILPFSGDAVNEVHFEDASDAGNSFTLANTLTASGTATLDNALIEIGSDGLMELDDASDGGTAEVLLDSRAVLDLRGHD